MTLKEIIFTPIERKIVNKIKNYALTLPSIVPRIVGGWVRDKLLGKESNDIDISINEMSGYEFALGMKAFYKSKGSIGQIKANPDKSKHLETAVMRIEGVFVDFLSLRKEEYFDTRIPMVKSCNAEEDAFRRDLTINTLFYNIIEEKVEDFTGKGISDLINGVMRTPMDPLQTLLDDPLRLLRIIRFCVRFKFRFAKDLLVVFKNDQVRMNLTSKISNERIGQEIYKILEYENFIEAFKVIVENDLTMAVFKKKIYIDSAMLKRTNGNLEALQEHFTFDKKIARLYVILLHNATLTIENTFSNFLIVKNYLCYGKNQFRKVKVVEKNLRLLKKVNEMMIDEDIVFLVRHMKEEYELSFLVYLMMADFEKDEIEEFFKQPVCLQEAVDDPKQKYEEVLGDDALKVAVNKNKRFIFHILNRITPYKDKLFSLKFKFNGKEIQKALEVEKDETSFYLEMARVQQIVYGSMDDELMKRVEMIKNSQRIKGFKEFYLTNIF